MSVIYLEKSDIGATLSTWLYCGMQMQFFAERLGKTGYHNWPNNPMLSLQPHQDPVMFGRYPNMYEWWFEQPLFANGTTPPREEAWLCERMPPIGDHNLYCQPLTFIKEYFRKHLRFNQEVQRRIDELVVKYQFDFSNTLAVSWRGCDSVDDGRPRMPIETYYPFIDDILTANPNIKHIFATAEETTVVDKLKARYPQVFEVSEFFSAPWGYKLHSEYVNPRSGYERGVQTCQLISLLSRCAYYVKNRSSMSAVAAWLSDGHIVNLAHPENLGFGFDITKAEIKGQLVPLNR